MKKFKTICFLTIFSFIISNCSKNEIVNPTVNENSILAKSQIENASMEQKLAYKKYRLLKLATYIAKNIPANSITSKIQAKGSEKGNFKSISVVSLINSFVNSKATPSLTDNAIQESLNAFKGLENENWQPMISVPFYKNKLNNKGLDDSKPIFILEQDAEKVADKIDGYQLDELEAMKKIDEKVTEEIAMSSIVYKMSIQIMPINYDPGEGGGGSGSGTGDINPLPGTGNTQPVADYGLKIQNIIIKDKKESWFETNDVCFVGFSAEINPAYSGDGGNALTASSNTYSYSGKLIDHFTNNDVNSQTNHFLNWLIQNNTDPLHGNVIYYVIFEHDNWPAPLRAHTFPFPNGTTRNVIFRSWENEYDAPQLYYNPNNPYSNPTPYPRAESYLKNDEWMKYNLTIN